MSRFTPEIAVLGLSIGLVMSLVCYLVTNLSPGGMISPAWLALLLVDDPKKVVLVGVVVAATFGLLLPLQKIVILYGKRLFATVVLVAVFLQMTVHIVVVDFYPNLFETTTLGFIVPGLVTYQLIRQPVGATLLSLTAVTAATYVVMLSGILLRFIPMA